MRKSAGNTCRSSRATDSPTPASAFAQGPARAGPCVFWPVVSIRPACRQACDPLPQRWAGGERRWRLRHARSLRLLRPRWRACRPGDAADRVSAAPPRGDDGDIQRTPLTRSLFASLRSCRPGGRKLFRPALLAAMFSPTIETACVFRRRSARKSPSLQRRRTCASGSASLARKCAGPACGEAGASRKGRACAVTHLPRTSDRGWV